MKNLIDYLPLYIGRHLITPIHRIEIDREFLSVIHSDDLKDCKISLRKWESMSDEELIIFLGIDKFKNIKITKRLSFKRPLGIGAEYNYIPNDSELCGRLNEDGGDGRYYSSCGAPFIGRKWESNLLFWTMKAGFDVFDLGKENLAILE